MSILTKITLSVVGVVAVAASSFYAGFTFNQHEGGQFESITQGVPAEMAQLYGEVEFRDENQLTLNMLTGERRIVHFSTSTPVITSVVDADQEALTIGTTLLILGTTGAEGSLAAQFITVLPDVE